jgi:hypothetical protein
VPSLETFRECLVSFEHLTADPIAEEAIAVALMARGGTYGRSNPHENLRCNHCKQLGHIKKHCHKWRKEQQRSNGGNSDEDEEAADRRYHLAQAKLTIAHNKEKEKRWHTRPL